MARILIIDDEQEMRDITAQIFKIEGYETDTAADADDAFFKIKNNKYNFLLVDLVLPGRMNGLDIIKKVRNMRPKIFIFAYSGFSGVDITEKVIRAGADNFITKPFSRKELVAMLNQAPRNSIETEVMIR